MDGLAGLFVLIAVFLVGVWIFNMGKREGMSQRRKRDVQTAVIEARNDERYAATQKEIDRALGTLSDVQMMCLESGLNTYRKPFSLETTKGETAFHKSLDRVMSADNLSYLHPSTREDLIRMRVAKLLEAKRSQD